MGCFPKTNKTNHFWSVSSVISFNFEYLYYDLPISLINLVLIGYFSHSLEDLFEKDNWKKTWCESLWKSLLLNIREQIHWLVIKTFTSVKVRKVITTDILQKYLISLFSIKKNVYCGDVVTFKKVPFLIRRDFPKCLYIFITLSLSIALSTRYLWCVDWVNQPHTQ